MLRLPALSWGLGIGLLAALAAASGPGETGAEAGSSSVHPETDGGTTCTECHEALTPEIVEEWRESQHGLLSVKCFVCHGDSGAGFMRRPSPQRCLGCHGEQVDSLAEPFFAGRDCFACHRPHGLDPHMSQKLKGGQP